MPPLADTITMVANNMFVATELLMLGFLAYWLHQDVKPSTHIILYAWLLVAIGYILRIGFWSVGLALHDFEPTHMRCTMDMIFCEPMSDPYPAFSTQYRWVQIFPAFLVLSGHLIFIAYIQGFNLWDKYIIGAAVALLSIAVAII